MKKAILLIIAVVMLVTFTACGGADSGEKADETKDIDMAAVTAEIVSSVDMSSMSEISADMLDGFYDIAPEDIEGFSLYICGSGGYADEVAVFKVTESGKDKVKSAISERIEKRTKDFEDYVPEEAEKLRGYTLKEKGSYIFLAVTPDNTTAEGIFDKAFE